MKILQSQNAMLSNYEVYQHLLETQQDTQKRAAELRKRAQPTNLSAIVKDVSLPPSFLVDLTRLNISQVLVYLRTAPGPLHQQYEKQWYSHEAILRLADRLRHENFGSELSKGELLSLTNLRPASNAVLWTIIDDIEERFTEDEQRRILDIIAEVLGFDEPVLDNAAAEADDRDDGIQL